MLEAYYSSKLTKKHKMNRYAYIHSYLFTNSLKPFTHISKSGKNTSN